MHVSGSAGYAGTITINPAGVTSLVGTSGLGNGGELEVDSAAALTDAAVVMNSTRVILFGPSAVNPVFGSLSGSGGFALNTTTAGVSAGTLTVGGLNTNTTYSGALSGSGALLKVGTGLLTLSHANTFTGGTIVSAGSMDLTVGGGTGTSGARHNGHGPGGRNVGGQRRR